jgi:nicotinamide-nucleotide amidase
MKAEIVSTGEELVLGATIDTNSAWLSVRLSELGIPVLRHTAVGDDLDQIVEALRGACSRAELVLMTGGLGPTEDDLTRPALAALTGRPLVTDPAALEQIRERFARMGRPMPPENAVQATHPEGSRMIANPHGTAPGIHAVVSTGAGNSADVFAMPGVPREMFPMFESAVLPFVGARGGSGKVMLIRMLSCFGLGESVIGERIKPLMKRGRNPSVGTNVKDFVVRVRVTGVFPTAEEAAAAVDADVAAVRSALGEHVFGEGEETLQHAVGRLLAERRTTVAVAESCTGGLVAGMLTDVPGISAHFLEGVVSYSNAAKVRLLGVRESTLAAHGAVSARTAEEMAAGCRERSGADLAVSLTGIAGPGGGTADKPVGLVFMGLSDGTGTVSRRFQFVGDRDQIRDRAAKTALNLLRLRLLRGTQWD